MTAFSGGGHNGRSVSRRGVRLLVDEKVRKGEFFNERLRRLLFHAVGFLSPAFRLFHFCSDRLDMVRQVFLRPVPQTPEEVIERPDARRVVRVEAAENRVKRRNAHGVDPSGDCENAKSQRQQVRTEHAGRQSRLRTKDGILVLHDGINRGQIKVAELLVNLPLGFRNDRQIGVTGAEILSQGVPVRGVTAGVDRFQSLRPPF